MDEVFYSDLRIVLSGKIFHHTLHICDSDRASCSTAQGRTEVVTVQLTQARPKEFAMSLL